MKKLLSLGLVVALSLTMLVACGAPAEESTTYTDGTYEGVGEGYKGEIKVKVEVKDGKITAIDILNIEETEGLGDVAAEEVAKKIIETQNIEVEAVSGATGSSNGIKEAVKNALEK